MTEKHPSKRGWVSRGGSERSEDTLRLPAKEPHSKPLRRLLLLVKVGGVTSRLREARQFGWVAADPWDPPRELQPFTWVPASAGGARASRAGGAVRTAAASLPYCSEPAGRLYIRGPGPGPGPCRSIGQSDPLHAAPEPPPSAPAEPRCCGRHREGGSSPLRRAPPPPPPWEVIPSVFTPLSLFFAGHPGQSEPVVTARVAWGEGGGGGDGDGKTGGRGAAPALATRGRAGRREGTAGVTKAAGEPGTAGQAPPR